MFHAETQQELKKSLRRELMNMQSRREHSAAELRSKIIVKLAQKHCVIDRSIVESLLDDALMQLQDDGLQSDRRFSEYYLKSRAEKLYGPLRIRTELIQKGVSQTLVCDVMDESGIDWPWSLQLLLDKKSKTDVNVLDESQRYKLMSYLARRGFDESQVRHLCGG